MSPRRSRSAGGGECRSTQKNSSRERKASTRAGLTLVSTSMGPSSPTGVTIILQVTTEAEALDAYSTLVSRVAEALAPSVANLRVRRGGGSGVVISTDGFLLTNAHVVAGRSGR